METPQRRQSSSAAASKRPGEVEVESHAHQVRSGAQHTAHGEVWDIDKVHPDETPDWYQPESGQPGPRDPDESARASGERDDRR